MIVSIPQGMVALILLARTILFLSNKQNHIYPCRFFYIIILLNLLKMQPGIWQYLSLFFLKRQFSRKSQSICTTFDAEQEWEKSILTLPCSQENFCHNTNQAFNAIFFDFEKPPERLVLKSKLQMIILIFFIFNSYALIAIQFYRISQKNIHHSELK